MDRETTAFYKREWLAVLSDLELEQIDAAFIDYARRPLNHTADGKPLAPHKSQIRALAIEARNLANPALRLPTMTEAERAALWDTNPKRAAFLQMLDERQVEATSCGGHCRESFEDFRQRRTKELLDEYHDRKSGNVSTGTRE